MALPPLSHQPHSSLPPPPPRTPHTQDAAVLDHFQYRAGSLRHGDTSHQWSQRFYVNDKYWSGDGAPIFLYIGGEGPQGAPSDHLYMATLAQAEGALMVALEHRFYGESQPTQDMTVRLLHPPSARFPHAFAHSLHAQPPRACSTRSLGYALLTRFALLTRVALLTRTRTLHSLRPPHSHSLHSQVGNLKFLTSEQALGDLARFTDYLKDASRDSAASSPPLTLLHSVVGSRVVTFGGSYPGALSAWFKLKYPASHAGAIASSAPVYAEYNYEQYAEVVGTALANPKIGGSQACYDAVQKAATELHAVVTGTSPYALDPTIPSELLPCNSTGTGTSAQGFASDLDLATYEASVFGNFQGAVQYNNESPGAPTVAAACAIMTNSTYTTPLEALAAAQAAFAGPHAKAVCVPSSFLRDGIEPLANTTFSNKATCNLTCSSMRQWLWQSCNEFGYVEEKRRDAKRSEDKRSEDKRSEEKRR